MTTRCRGVSTSVQWDLRSSRGSRQRGGRIRMDWGFRHDRRDCHENVQSAGSVCCCPARSRPIGMKSQDARRSSGGAPRATAPTETAASSVPTSSASASPDDEDLTTVIRRDWSCGDARLANLSDTEGAELVRFLRALRPRAGSGPERGKATLTGGQRARGLVGDQSASDMQMLGDDRKVHLLRKNGTQYVPSPRRPTGPAITGRATEPVTARSRKSTRPTPPG